jgi:hypothetical protein
MAINPLQYKQHLRRDEEYSQALKTAAAHRASFLPYTTSQRILNKNGLSLSRTDYYNIHRQQAAGDAIRSEFQSLIFALDEAGFTNDSRVEFEVNEAGE